MTLPSPTPPLRSRLSHVSQDHLRRLLPDEPDPVGGGLLRGHPLRHPRRHFGSVVRDLRAPHLSGRLLWLQETCEFSGHFRANYYIIIIINITTIMYLFCDAFGLTFPDDSCRPII